MGSYANPHTYWEARLSRSFDLTGTGFQSLGRNYNRVLYRTRLAALERALGAVGWGLSGRTVLEAGCGTGFYTEVCRRAGVASYTGLDITAVSVERLAPLYPEFTFARADISEEPADPEGAFDVVLAADVLFHIVDDGRFRAALAGLARSVRPQGLLILSDVLPAAPVTTAPHCRLRSLADYQSVLAGQGLSVRHVEPIFAILQPPPLLPGYTLAWRAYARVWQYGLMPFARQAWFDRVVPPLLGKMDTSFFLRRAGMQAPSSKWLVATKAAAAAEFAP